MGFCGLQIVGDSIEEFDGSACMEICALATSRLKRINRPTILPHRLAVRDMGVLTLIIVD
jgi:hypothetical protein